MRVTDRFHVQKLASEALQDLRVHHRWEALDAENEANEKAKDAGMEFKPAVLENGDTLKQLLARSRYVLYKNAADWTSRQRQRAKLLSDHVPTIAIHGWKGNLGCSIFSKLPSVVFTLTIGAVSGFCKGSPS